MVVLWRRDPDFARAIEAVGAVFIAGQPDTPEILAQAGVVRAITILALSGDDQLNLHAALLARDANSTIRIVLRQFNRRLARKIEQNLPDCSVVSLAWESAATYAAAALDPSCFRGLQFPEPDGPLTGFATRIAENCGVGDFTVAEAEQTLSARIVAIEGEAAISRDEVIAPQEELTVYGDLGKLQRSAPSTLVVRTRATIARRLRHLRRRRERSRLNPILVRLALAALVVFAAGIAYFRTVFHDTWLDAAYFVVATMTTTGYGDITPNRHDKIEIIAAMLLMLSGTALTGLFIAFGASLLTRVQWVTLQGLRPVHRRGHIIVCGAGNIGSGVIELLLTLGKRLVVIEQTPDTAIVELAQERRFDLLTGDASRDETLDLCNIRCGAQHNRPDQCRHAQSRNRSRCAGAQSDNAGGVAHRRTKFCRVDRAPLRVSDDVLGRGIGGAGFRRLVAVCRLARPGRLCRPRIWARRIYG